MKDRVLYDSVNRITQPWGDGSHKGIDLGYNLTKYTEAQNFDVYANCKGVVDSIQTGIPNDTHCSGARTWGNYVYIRHPNGMYSRYAHLKSVLVSVGQEVDENTKIGIMGDTGFAFGVHLHFEVATGWNASLRIDPTPYLTKAIYEPPAPTPAPSPTPVVGFSVGDRVLVKGRGYYTSQGGLPQTALYTGNKNDPSDYLYITKIAEGSPYPYHLGRTPKHGEQNRGWFAKDEITKA